MSRLSPDAQSLLNDRLPADVTDGTGFARASSETYGRRTRPLLAASGLEAEERLLQVDHGSGREEGARGDGAPDVPLLRRKSADQSKYTALKDGLRLCACGCGQPVPIYKNRLYRFVFNHHTKFPRVRRAHVGWRRSHELAVEVKRDIQSCEWEHIGGCKGPLHVAHLDGNQFNNHNTNLKKLCHSHHFLLDRGRINPLNPKMPSFRVSAGGGKRRYAYREASK